MKIIKRIKGSFVFILLVILGTFLYIPKIYQGYRTVAQLQNELEDITLEGRELQKEKEELTIQVKELNSLYAVEKFVRNNLAMKKKNETIYRVIYEEE
jgi:cell division protein FtsL